jgi:uncharacterized protein (TIGR00369 family)
MPKMPTFLDLTKERIEGKRQGPPIAELLGFRVTAAEDGRARVELNADERLANPMGTLHGGVSCDISDAAMGITYASALQEGERFTTLELKINFLRPGRPGGGTVSRQSRVASHESRNDW